MWGWMRVELWSEGRGIKACDVKIVGVNERMREEAFAGGIVGDVEELTCVVDDVADAVFVVAVLPEFAKGGFADRVRGGAFDQLHAAGGGVVDCRGDQGVEVIGHDDEAVELEAVCVAMTEEGRDNEIGVAGGLEEAPAMVGDEGESVRLGRLADGGHGRKAYPRG